MKKFQHHCIPENAPKFLEWIKSRGGVAVWKSINLSNPSAGWSSPATIRIGDCNGFRNGTLLNPICPKCWNPISQDAVTFGTNWKCDSCGVPEGGPDNYLVEYPKPNWQAENKPSQVITDPEQIGVETEKEWKRFRIHTRLGGTGLMVKLTDHSSKRVREAVEKCSEETGAEASYHFDYDTQEAVITYTSSVVSLAEWAKSH